MHHFICIDSFKGCLSSSDAARAIRTGILSADPDATIDWSPVADGGEGTLEALSANGFRELTATTIDLAGRPIQVTYVQKGQTAVIEVATICGLYLKRPEEAALLLDTRGVGRLVRHVLGTNVSEMFLALGGTATTDGGLGFLFELGADLLTQTGQPIPWQTNPLLETKQIRLPKEIDGLHVLADVTATYAGKRGAAHVFGPQKGLTVQEIEQLDTRLGDIGKQLGIDRVPGAGAAGGLGGAAYALGASIDSGAAYILRVIDAEERIKRADYVWTGEGRIDRQTMMGKLPATVVAFANRSSVPCILLAGEVTERLEQASVCETIHDPDEETTLDPVITKKRLTRRAEQIVRRLMTR
ncbi:glycerate kinase [Exiguobacterium antarcticum]|uniref:glycerate kinase family protein n=1 Tax=Exiguobacterium antarcticum TaxID=132920 RepID=UPI000285E9CF|nr:glycerate kinase [Exiguobacterium antarcticum]AFS71492.1 Glycerate kinase [Exiguobacterium antarcticum B7]